MALNPTFFDGKLFLVGHALALFRPHVAQSTNQAALHCLRMKKHLKEEIGLNEYEEQVISFARNTLLWSREVGSEYLGSYAGHFYNKMKNRLARNVKCLGVRL